jgi:hypothetical protein
MGALKAAVRESGGSSHAKTNDGHTGTKSRAASAGNPQILAHFTRPRKAEGQDN